MKLLDYIDFRTIFETVKKNQLSLFPTAEDYIEYLDGFDEDYSFVRPLYNRLNQDLSHCSFPSSEEWELEDVLEFFKGDLIIELSHGGNDSNENGDNFWGYGYQFVIDMEEELFNNYTEENYS